MVYRIVLAALARVAISGAAAVVAVPCATVAAHTGHDADNFAGWGALDDVVSGHGSGSQCAAKGCGGAVCVGFGLVRLGATWGRYDPRVARVACPLGQVLDGYGLRAHARDSMRANNSRLGFSSSHWPSGHDGFEL